MEEILEHSQAHCGDWGSSVGLSPLPLAWLLASCISDLSCHDHSTCQKPLKGAMLALAHGLEYFGPL